MNLEEELRVLSDDDLAYGISPEQAVTQPVAQGIQQNESQPIFTQPMNSQNTNIQPTVSQPINSQNMNVQPIMNQPINNQNINTQPNLSNISQEVVSAQPSIVSTGGSSQPFNWKDDDFNPNSALGGRGPLKRLTGNQGERFRVHLVPTVKPKETFIHYNPVKQVNFTCLSRLYGTSMEDCCREDRYGRPKHRIILPVIVMPVLGNQVVNGPGSLAVIVLGERDYSKLIESIMTQGAESDGVSLSTVDIIATVDSPRFKSFTFNAIKDSEISKVTNVNELVAEWKSLATHENVASVAARVLTRDEYNNYYSDFNVIEYNAAHNNQQSSLYGVPGYAYQGDTQQGYGQQPYVQPNYAYQGNNQPNYNYQGNNQPNNGYQGNSQPNNGYQGNNQQGYGQPINYAENNNSFWS